MNATQTFQSHPMMRAFAAAVRANVPVLIWGMPDQGKTATIESWGSRNGYQVETVVGAIREASDFIGLPVEVDGQVVYSPPAWAKRLCKAERGLLFLDELTTSAPSVQRAMLRITQERKVGDLTLPGSVAIVAAANPPDIAVDGWDLPAPIANRMFHLDWYFDADAWLDGVMNGFGHAEQPSLDDLLGEATESHAIAVKSAVTTFLKKAAPHLRTVVPTDPSLAGKGWPSPRSWTNATAILAELDPCDEDARYLVLVGCVGESAAKEFLAWSEANDLYDPEEVLANPKIVNWTERPDRIFALIQAITALVRSRADRGTRDKALAAMVACAKASRPDLAWSGTRSILEFSTQMGWMDIPDEVAAAFEMMISRVTQARLGA